MRITPTLHFAGRSADSSRTVTPEPEDTRPSSPDSIHSDPETEQQLKIAGTTAKDLLKRGAISRHEYDLMTGGLDRAHLEIRSKTDLGRAWQTHSRKLDSTLDKVWDDLNETEEQLAVVQRNYETTDTNLDLVQGEYIKTLNALNQYKAENAELIHNQVRLNREVVKLSADKPQPQPEIQRASSKKLPMEPQKTPPHQMTLRQRLLTHHKEQAELSAKRQMAPAPNSQ